MKIGDIIRNYRDAHAMSMEAFAKKADISKQYVSFLEKNQHPKTGKPIEPSVKILKKIADGMDIDFDELLNLIDPDTSITFQPSLMRDLSDKDIEMLNKYHALDDSGREMVDMTIEMQYKRVTQDKKGTGQLFA